MVEYLFVLIAICLGNVLSVLIPYVRKWYLNRSLLFDWRYIIDSAVVAVWEFIFSIPLYAMWIPTADMGSDLVILICAFAFGIGGYRLQTEVLKIIIAIRKKP